MFFIGIFGVEEKEKEIKEFINTVCPCCGQLTRAVLIARYTYFHIFFIPTFRWNRQYFLRYRCCGGIYEVNADYFKNLKDASEIDIRKIKKKFCSSDAQNVYCQRCAGCGKEFEKKFSFCPYCGRKVL